MEGAAGLLSPKERVEMVSISSKVTFTPRVTLNTNLIYQRISARVNRVVAVSGKAAFTVARTRAPVRRIFKGKFGPNTTLRVRSTGESSIVRLTPGALHGSPGGSGLIGNEYSRAWEDAYVERNFIQSHWNRTNNRSHRASNTSWNQTWEARLATITNPRYERHTDRVISGSVSLDPGYSKYLTSRGRYEVKHAIARGSLLDTGEGSTVGGKLRGSIELDDMTSGTHISWAVRAGGPTAPYAKFMEFGTRHAKAHPFLRPALKQVETSYSQRMRAGLRNLTT